KKKSGYLRSSASRLLLSDSASTKTSGRFPFSEKAASKPLSLEAFQNTISKFGLVTSANKWTLKLLPNQTSIKTPASIRLYFLIFFPIKRDKNKTMPIIIGKGRL